jgi:polyisoprenoid-binding protein YceI
MKARRWAPLLALLWMAAAAAAEIDPAASHFGFLVTTRWGQELQGHIAEARGEVGTLVDGRRQVRLRLAAGSVEIGGHPTYTRFARGRGFFNAERYPAIEFVSEPYSLQLLRDGGPLPGLLAIRGVQRREVFRIEPSACALPARECDVVASGSVRRGDFGLGRWGFALADEVRFSLRVRVRDDGA